MVIPPVVPFDLVVRLLLKADGGDCLSCSMELMHEFAKATSPSAVAEGLRQVAREVPFAVKVLARFEIEANP